MFSSILIANRGEIALRIARTCREAGIRTVAVHSTADRGAGYLEAMDERVQIGPADARRSYLNPAAIVEAALRTGAEAVHPGYGFLSEDPYFPEICEDNGLVFVGPPSKLLNELANKAWAREAALAAGLPVLTGTGHAIEDAAEAKEQADAIGYPVIIKAAAGGGGRGMAPIHSSSDFSPTFMRTRAAAQNLFGDPRLYVERYLDAARHVEVQILADTHGNVAHLGARDCSVQRRRQKLVEETPPPSLPSETTERMCRAAVHMAHEIGYVGAGTFEFIVDGDGHFFFMELNCRIQVEHPVTEIATGVDIVRVQLDIASGQPLALTDTTPRGAAIECRINAEAPERDFRPTPGTITAFDPPGGPFVRVDTHVTTDLQVTADYDPLLAKLIAWGQDRAEAIVRLDRALSELHVSGPGVFTTTEFVRDVLAHPLYRDARHTTSLINQITSEHLTSSEDNL